MKRAMYILATALLISGCSDEKKAEMVHSVMTVQPQVLSTTAVKQFAGQVKGQADVNLGFKTAGQILKIYVKEGQQVSKGQLLARLDDADYNLGVKAAQAQYTQLQNEVERIGKLYESKSISANDYEKATYGLEQVSVNLENNQNKLKYTRLYAPENGVIQSINFEEMEMVNAGTAVFNISYNRDMEVEVSIPAKIYAQKEHFKGAHCSIDGQKYEARLLSIVPKADNTQLYKATFIIVNSGKDVVSGMNATVNIEINSSQDTAMLSVPANAIFEDGGKSYVWIVSKDSIVNKQEVTTGGTAYDGNIAITSGLTGDEILVKAGVKVLQDNEHVKVISQDSETNIGGML